jgi:hypothetical protein
MFLTHTGTFLHAPAMRRVGKSTTVDMLAAMARGEKEMFEGYAVNSADSPFCIGEQPLSLIRLDFSSVAESIALDMGEKEALAAVRKAFVGEIIRSAMRQHKLDLSGKGSHPGVVLEEWIDALREQEDSSPIVMLIDEYDSPVAAFLPKHPVFAEHVADMMSPFYSTIKKRGDCFHKVFVTGVSKFSNTSLFSKANQFLPIMENTPKFCTLYGFTETEIRETYGPFIEERFDRSLDEVVEDMRRMYNGYCFHPEQSDEDKVFNPWSVLGFLHTERLRPHWTSTATSSTVADMLGLHGLDILNGFNITMNTLFAPISAKQHPEHWRQMAFQSGYATIQKAAPRGEFGSDFDLEMGVPNEEVKMFLENEMVELLVGNVEKSVRDAYAKSLLNLEFKEAEAHLVQVIAGLEDRVVPTNEDQFGGYAVHMLRSYLDQEGGVDQFHAVYTQVSGDRNPARDDKVTGRTKESDGVLVFEHQGVWQLVVIETKFDKSAKAALAQITAKDYVDRAKEYVKQRLPGVDVERCTVHKVGINMNSTDRGVQLQVAT